MEYLEKVLQLPYQTLAILIAGYLAYRVAYVGRDGAHTTIDSVAIMMVFCAIAQAATAGLLSIYQALFNSQAATQIPLWAGYIISTLGLIVSIAAAGLWRMSGAAAVSKLLRLLRVSTADRNITAWQTVIDNEHAGPSAVVVLKKDGSAVACDKLADFQDAAFQAAVFGHDGSIALYVTSSKAKGEEWITIDPNHDDWGPEITVIPADEISEIRVRHNPKLVGKIKKKEKRGAQTKS